jgi:hypothetical protein
MSLRSPWMSRPTTPFLRSALRAAGKKPRPIVSATPTSSKGRLSASASSVIDIRSFCASCEPSTKNFPRDVPLHVILDNYSTHKP